MYSINYSKLTAGTVLFVTFYPLDDVATVACCLSSDQMQLARNAKVSIHNVIMRTVPFVKKRT